MRKSALCDGDIYYSPHRKYFTQNMLPKMHSETEHELQNEMQSIMGIGLTTDAWTNCGTDSFVAYTAHYITKDWELKGKVLSAKYSEESHSAANIAADMKKTEEDYFPLCMCMTMLAM